MRKQNWPLLSNFVGQWSSRWRLFKFIKSSYCRVSDPTIEHVTWSASCLTQVVVLLRKWLRTVKSTSRTTTTIGREELSMIRRSDRRRTWDYLSPKPEDSLNSVLLYTEYFWRQTIFVRVFWCNAVMLFSHAYEARLATFLAARNDRDNEHIRAHERYKKVRALW